MSHLPFTEIADRASDIENYLPPLPAPGRDPPAVNAYRNLGAMALLDIDGWKGESEKRIEQYYLSTLKHIQDGSVFIGLRPDGRPLGFATWTTGGSGKSPCSDNAHRSVIILSCNARWSGADERAARGGSRAHCAFGGRRALDAVDCGRCRGRDLYGQHLARLRP
jgi:hypothetical protein